MYHVVMDNYHVEWQGSALRALRRIPQDYQARIRATARGLATDPRPHSVTKLHGEWEGFYGVKVTQRYRVLYSIDDNALQVVIVLVGSREGVY
jgi:addiction module RelE/StbE family toxin